MIVNTEDLAPVREMAQEIGVGRTTVWKWIERGKINVYRPWETVALVSRKEIKEYLDGRKSVHES